MGTSFSPKAYASMARWPMIDPAHVHGHNLHQAVLIESVARIIATLPNSPRKIKTMVGAVTQTHLVGIGLGLN
ncbi:hypothetical protein BST61_g7687 [Cercospora zeina]